jgi:hypothetical protein
MTDENISFFIDDTDVNGTKVNESEQLNVSNLLGEYENQTEDYRMSQLLNYQLNMTVQQLLRICSYYGIAKGLNKCAKDILVTILVDFEENEKNATIVSQRRLMWFYIEELRNDKFMKKFVFW